MTPLHNAAMDNDNPAIIRILVAAGAEVGARTWGPSSLPGSTPLHLAALYNPVVIRALLEAGAEVDARNEDGMTPLHEAAGWSDNPAAIRALVAAGAEVNARAEYYGLTPLHVAARYSDSPAVIEALLAAGADAGSRTTANSTPWDLAQGNETLRGIDVWWMLYEGRFR